MKRPFLIFMVACAVAMATAKHNQRESKTAATLSPPGDFDFSSHPPTNTTTAHVTTHANTTTAHVTTHANTTTAHVTTHANTTTAHVTTHATPTPAPPEPTPNTNLTVGNYSVKNPGGALCVKAVMAVQIKLRMSGKPSDMGSFIIQPAMVTPEGSCTDSQANLTLSFKEGALALLFKKNSTMNSVYVDTIAFNVSYPIVHSVRLHSIKNESLHLLPSKVGHYYSCRNQTLFMGYGYSLEMSSLKLQAFNFTKDDFGLPDPCPADQTDYSVAIAVGVVLIILIIIVVLVYLIGRRRRADGYQAL